MPVTVVDNSSLPEIAELCAELGVRYIDPGRNGGFGAGVNRALADRLVPGADVLLLNPDARITADQIDCSSGCASFRPVSGERRPRSGRRARPSRARRVAVPVARQCLAGGDRSVPSPARSALRDRLRAAAARRGARPGRRVRRAFFLYAEETDWAYRAHLLGWRHALVPARTRRARRRRHQHRQPQARGPLPRVAGALLPQALRCGRLAVARAAAWVGAMFRAAVLPGERGREARRRAALYRLGPVRVESRVAGTRR